LKILGKEFNRENALVLRTLKEKSAKSVQKVDSPKMRPDRPTIFFFSLGLEQKDLDGPLRFVKNRAKFTPIFMQKRKNTQKVVMLSAPKNGMKMTIFMCFV